MSTASSPFSILILGGYGVFGKRIAQQLAKDASLRLIIAGRNQQSAKHFASEINSDWTAIDMTAPDFAETLSDMSPSLVINCCGPFQGQEYTVARHCIEAGIHYIDLADARDYVCGFSSLHQAAADAGVTVISGASTVPAISSAILDSFLDTSFSTIHSIDYGVTPGNQTDRGIATVAAILSYVGKPFTTRIENQQHTIFGWQDLHCENYPHIGRRWMSNCDIPDLDLFAERYPYLHTIRFYAGLELSILHLGLWLLSWLVRYRLISSLVPCAALFRRISLFFYSLGSADGGMHMKLTGLDKGGNDLQKSWYLIASGGDGPYVPTLPAVILAQKLARGGLNTGAYPAVGLITRDEILQATHDLDIREFIL